MSGPASRALVLALSRVGGAQRELAAALDCLKPVAGIREERDRLERMAQELGATFDRLVALAPQQAEEDLARPVIERRWDSWDDRDPETAADAAVGGGR